MAGGLAELRFAELQSRLRPFEGVGGDRPRTVVSLNSINLDRALLAREAVGLSSYEERALYWLLALRYPHLRLVVVTAEPVPDDVVEYYLSFLPDPADARSRLVLLACDDRRPLPLSVKVLDRPDLIDRLRRLVAHDPEAFIMPFNVRAEERELALLLDRPIYGVDDRFAEHGTKSGGRRLFAAAGVRHPRGFEDVRTHRAVLDSIVALRKSDPGLGAVVVKQNDNAFGAGNAILGLTDLPRPGSAMERAALDVRLRALPAEFIDAVTRDGGVVEEMIAGADLRSPSVQVRIMPDAGPLVLSTHDQVLGGESSQVFVGCRLPASADYATTIIDETMKIGRAFAEMGVVGRFGVDFVVTRGDDSCPNASAIEINLREGGTSHPWGTLWLLSRGHLDPCSGSYVTPTGPKTYFATDHVESESYRDVPLAALLDATAKAGVRYSEATGTGVVLHMLRSLDREGRVSAVAIADTPEEANESYLRLGALMDELAETGQFG